MNMDYKNEEIQPHERICYVDMDGVLADFDKSFYEISGKTSEDTPDPELWRIIDSHGKVKFFSELPWMSGGQQLWNYVINNFLKVKILTALGKSDAIDKKTSTGKRAWLHHNIPTLSDSDIIMVSNKHQKKRYSSPGSIIIDDTPIVIREWVKKGGIGILHKDVTETIGKLKQYA